MFYGVKVKNSEGLKKLNEKNNYQKQDCLVINKEMVSKHSRKNPN